MWKEIGKAWRTAWCGIKEHWCAMWRAFGGFWGVWDYRMKYAIVILVIMFGGSCYLAYRLGVSGCRTDSASAAEEVWSGI